MNAEQDPRDIADAAYRHVPFDIDVEQAILGSFMHDGNSYWRSVEILKPEHFYDPFHARIYETIGAMCAKDQRVNPLSVHALLKSDPGALSTGGKDYFDAMYGAAPALPNVRDLSNILRDLAIRRSIIAAAEKAIGAAYDPPLETTAEAIADKAAEQLFEASKGSESEGAVSIRDLARRAAVQAEQAMNMPSSVCLTSGLVAVDEHLGGIYRGDLTVLAGAPNMGKTALLEHLLKANASAENAEEAIMFSLEMMAQQVATRELAMRARVPSDLIRRGKISDRQLEKLQLAAMQFPELPYHIDGTRRLSVAQMRARVQARKRRSNKGVSLVGIDHLRFVKPARPRDDEKDQLQQVTSDLKDMAAELDVAIVLVSHVNREYAKRSTARPQLGDLYGSSAIEQNADAVWFIHREIYYLKRNPPPASAGDLERAKWQVQCENADGKAEIFAAKQRMGPIGSAAVLFEEQFTAFSDVEKPPTQEEIDLWRLNNLQGEKPFG